MNYTIANIKQILVLEISRMGKDFVLDEFMERFKLNIDNSIINIEGNYLLNNTDFIIINTYMENENPRHFNKNIRKSFSFAIKEENKVHCFDIPVIDPLIVTLPTISLKNKDEMPYCFYVSDDDMDVLLFKKEGRSLIRDCDVCHDF